MDFFKGSSEQGQGQGQGLFGLGSGTSTSTDSGLGSGLSSLGSGLSSTINSGINSIKTGLTGTPGTPGTPAAAPAIGFYTIVVAIAAIILILVLAFLGWTMSKQRRTDNFPKLQTACPDYWEITDADGKTYCKQPLQTQVNSGDVKASSPDTPGFAEGKFDFTNAGWSAGGNAVCAKKKWANSHGINWDTVTNANYC